MKAATGLGAELAPSTTEAEGPQLNRVFYLCPAAGPSILSVAAAPPRVNSGQRKATKRPLALGRWVTSAFALGGGCFATAIALPGIYGR